MKKVYLCSFFFFFVLSILSAIPGRGYVVTKNGIHLTGSIGEIYHSNLASEVIFTNDLGTTYSYRPELISGFVFEKNAAMIAYESKFDRKKWVFFEVVEKGDGISLYRAPEDKIQIVMEDAEMRSYTYKSEEFWVEVKGRLPIQITRFNFRKKMRRLLHSIVPELAEKIGKPGYRYKNILDIVEECNKTYRKGSKFI